VQQATERASASSFAELDSLSRKEKNWNLSDGFCGRNGSFLIAPDCAFVFGCGTNGEKN
jgi:hypothetical protein